MDPSTSLDDLPERLGAVIKADPNYRRLLELGPPDAEPEPRCARCRDAGYLRRDVPAGHPEFGRIVACSCTRPRLEAARMQRFWAASAAPAAYRTCTLESYPGDPAVVDHLREWLESDRWLVLAGEYGAGKTGLTVALLRELHERGSSGLFVNAPAMLRRVRATYAKGIEAAESESAVVDSLAEADVLAIDDVGKERLSQWGTELLYDVVNRRYSANLRTILTTNLVPQMLELHVGSATFWRVFERADWLTMHGNLRRRRTTA